MIVTRVRHPNASEDVLVCESNYVTRTITLDEARAILDANPEAAGTESYDALMEALG